MLPTKLSCVLVPMLLLPLALLQACATQQPLQPVVVPPPAIPPLPAQARQPETPAWCSPTCSDGWKLEVETWRDSLTNAASPAPAASAPTTR